jgi:hypothetical protein
LAWWCRWASLMLTRSVFRGESWALTPSGPDLLWPLKLLALGGTENTDVWHSVTKCDQVWQHTFLRCAGRLTVKNERTKPRDFSHGSLMFYLADNSSSQLMNQIIDNIHHHYYSNNNCNDQIYLQYTEPAEMTRWVTVTVSSDYLHPAMISNNRSKRENIDDHLRITDWNLSAFHLGLPVVDTDSFSFPAIMMYLIARIPASSDYWACQRMCDDSTILCK